MKPLTYVALFAGIWSPLVFALSPQTVQGPPVISVRTELVTLPVTVVDRRGRLVYGLRQEHFSVYDGGERQAIELFATGDVPATIGLLIDSSRSMSEKRQEVTAAASAFAAMGHAGDQFFTINFNEVVWPGLPAGVDFTEDVDELTAALAAAPARGMTALHDAVDRALDHLELGTRDRKALIVVSDGGDNASVRTLEAVLERARRTNTVIYAVTLSAPADREARPHVMKRLAADTGGHAFRPDQEDDVMSAFAEIANEIRAGYVIAFSAPESSRGGFRPVRVAVDAGDGRQLIARTRAGYYAGPSGNQ